MTESPVIQLAPKPTVVEENKRQVLEILRDLIKEAEAGEIGELFIIARRPGGFWRTDTGVTALTSLLGQIELARWRLCQRYYENLGGNE